MTEVLLFLIFLALLDIDGYVKRLVADSEAQRKLAEKWDRERQQ